VKYCKKCGCVVQPLMMGERPFNTPKSTDYVMCPFCDTIFRRDIKTVVNWPEVTLVEVQSSASKEKLGRNL